MGDTLPIFERLTLNRNFKVMKLLNSFLLASATAGTCEKSGNYGCTGGTKSDRHFLRWITGQTADTCKSECLKDEECQDFVLVWSGTCYLYSGECDRRPQSNAEYYNAPKGIRIHVMRKAAMMAVQIRMASQFVIAAPILFSFWTMMENHAFKNAPLTMAVVMRLPSAPTLRK